MICPHCASRDNRVIATRDDIPEHDRRRHRCFQCNARWTTIASLEPGSLELSTELPTTPQGVDKPLRVLSDPDLRSDPDLTQGHRGIPAGARSKSFADLIVAFAARWERSYKRPYPVSPADRSQLGRFMRDHGEYIETFAAICDRYLSDRRQFVIDRSNGHTLKWLVTSGLAMYGGQPRETAEQYADRIRKEHEARKRRGPTKSPELRALVLSLANGKELR